MSAVGIRRRLLRDLRAHGAATPQVEAAVDRAWAYFDPADDERHAPRSCNPCEYGRGPSKEVWTVVSVGQSTHHKLRTMAESRNVSMASIVESLIVVELTGLRSSDAEES